MMEMYEKAGKIVADVRELAVNHVKGEMKILDLVEFVEEEIKKRGGFPAFPCNVSINEVTAHYTSPPGDQTIIKFGDLVKIDLGAHIDGYIADSAVSVLVEQVDSIESSAGPSSSTDEAGKKKGKEKEEKEEFQLKMIETAQNALYNAISTIRDGVEVGKIGKVVEETVTSEGLNPVSNLTGHSMDRWILHSGVSIPNIKEENRHKIEEGDVLAIEPFVTNGVGRVVDVNQTHIFRFLRHRPMRVVQARKLLEHIEKDYHNLPFAQRWLLDSFKAPQLNMAMNQLISSRAVYPYHVLKEKSNARVAQAEHTVIVEPDGCKVITE
jgi:methionyl aminopeptidase